MNKSEKYYSKVETDFSSVDNKCKVAKTMNHKTLEDVKKITSPIQTTLIKLTNRHILRFQEHHIDNAINFCQKKLTELEKLKL